MDVEDEHGSDDEEPRPRYALVLVPGVGDEAEGVTAAAFGGALTEGWSEFAWAEKDRPSGDGIVVGVPEDREAERGGERYVVQRRRLTWRPWFGGTRDVDLLEMRWADLSRPPTGLIAFFGSLFGLGLQFATIALEALAPQWRSGPRSGLARAARYATEAGSYLLAILAIGLTVTVAGLGTALWLTQLDTGGAAPIVLAAAVAFVGAIAAWKLGTQILQGGWRWPRWKRVAPTVMVLLYAAAFATAADQWQATGSLQVGLSRALLAFGGFGTRIVWLGVVLVFLVALGLLTAEAVVHRRGGDESRAGPRRALTTLASASLSPLVVAVTGALLVGGIGAFVVQTAQDARWGADAGEVRCLEHRWSWTWTGSCASGSAGPDAAAEIERTLRAAEGLGAEAARLRSEGSERFETRALSDARALEAAAGDLEARAASLESAADLTPAQWGSRLYTQIAFPLVVPLIGALVLLAAAILSVLPAWSTGPARPRERDRPRRLLDGLVLLLRRWGAVAGVLIVSVLAMVYVALSWLPVLPSGLRLPPPDATVLGASSAAILIVLAVLRLVPIDPRDWRGSVGSGLEWVRREIVDRVYDVAIYLRIDRGDGVRSRIAARFHAVLARVATDYEGIVVVAHSQGTVLAAGVLFGDDARRCRHGGRWAIAPFAPPPGAAPGIALVTCASPLRQLYDERLPGQYARLWEAWPPDPRSTAQAWVNAYRTGDPVGRAVFRDPATHPPSRSLPVNGPLTDTRDVCLGPGGHTRYWSDHRFAAVVRSVLARLEVPPPAGR